MQGYKHIWGQGIVDADKKDLSALKLRRCMQNLKIKSGNVLEIGCGAGRFVRSVKALRPRLNCYGCDIDEASINAAKSYKDGISYAVADADSLPYKKDFFDAVLMFDIVEHVEDTGKLLSEVLRVARKNAIIHIYVPCEGEPLTLHWLLWKIRLGHNLKKKHAGHVQRFTKKGFIDAINKNFEIKNIQYSTYLIGQLIDILFYALQEIGPFKKKLLSAHVSKDAKNEKESIAKKIMKGIINLAFLISYSESRIFKMGLFAQGLHITCLKK